MLSWPTLIKLKPVKGVAFFSRDKSEHSGAWSCGEPRPTTGPTASGLNLVSDPWLGLGRPWSEKRSLSRGLSTRLLKVGL